LGKIIIITLLLIFLLPITAFANTFYTINSDNTASLNLTLEPCKPTNLNSEQLNMLLAGTGLEGLGAAYVRGEQSTGINALFILSINCLESGYGSSPLSERQNNIGGVKRSDDSGKYRSYESKSECVADIFRFISKKYDLTSIKSVGKVYCQPMGNWAIDIESIMKKFIKEIEEK
jgi:hypothetical protein